MWTDIKRKTSNDRQTSIDHNSSTLSTSCSGVLLKSSSLHKIPPLTGSVVDSCIYGQFKAPTQFGLGLKIKVTNMEQFNLNALLREPTARVLCVCGEGAVDSTQPNWNTINTRQIFFPFKVLTKQTLWKSDERFN